MNNTYSFLRSGTFYTIVLMFLVGGFQNITSFLPAGGEPVIMAVLGVIATWLHVNLATNLGARN
jgi:hypothetical protein